MHAGFVAGGMPTSGWLHGAVGLMEMETAAQRAMAEPPPRISPIGLSSGCTRRRWANPSRLEPSSMCFASE